MKTQLWYINKILKLSGLVNNLTYVARNSVEVVQYWHCGSSARYGNIMHLISVARNPSDMLVWLINPC
jgi:hypothetical protein